MSKYSDKVKARLSARQEETKPVAIKAEKIADDTLKHIHHSAYCNYCIAHHAYCFGEKNEREIAGNA